MHTVIQIGLIGIVLGIDDRPKEHILYHSVYMRQKSKKKIVHATRG